MTASPTPTNDRCLLHGNHIIGTCPTENSMKAQTLKDIFVEYKVFERSWSGRDASRIEKQRDELEAAIKAWAKELVGPHESLTEEQIANGRIYRLGDPQGDAVDRYKDELCKKIDDAS